MEISLETFFFIAKGKLILFRSPDRSTHWKKETPTNDTIELRGLNKSVLWSELDRWDYSNPDVPSGTPPPYTLYTFLTLGGAFQVFLVIMGVHTLAMLIAKIATSREFRNKSNMLGKLIHVIQNLRRAFKRQKRGTFL